MGQEMGEHPKGKRRLKLFFLIIGIVSFIILLYFVFVPRPVKVDLAVAAKGTFQQTIQADGILRSKEIYTVPAFADGDIKRVSLKVGDPIEKGQVITELFWDVKYDPVRAPISGVISKIYRESAGPIRRGEAIVEIIDPNNLEIMVDLLTIDAIRLEPGDPVIASGQIGGPPIYGKVTRISKAGFTKQSALGVEEERTEVTADLVNMPEGLQKRLGHNFHIEVKFLISEIPEALKVPIGALFREGPNWMVFAVDENRARKKKVAVSGTNSQEAAIGEGLVEGEKVIIYPGDLVKDGAAISATR